MMQHGICTLAMMPMRSEPRHGAEMVNMLLFGETFAVLESVEKWHHIRCDYDDYEGWISARKIEHINTDYRMHYANEPVVYLDEMSAVALCGENALRLTFGSRIPLFRETSFSCSGTSWTLQAHTKIAERATEGKAILETAKHYLHTPYLWGGRSIFGIDCSGLTQMAFMLNGIKLPRDAYQQAEQGINVTGLENARAGDLAFFAEKEKISHVGILTGDGHILHASEKVRIDKIDEKGIFNAEINDYTLSTKLIRRMII